MSEAAARSRVVCRLASDPRYRYGVALMKGSGSWEPRRKRGSFLLEPKALIGPYSRWEGRPGGNFLQVDGSRSQGRVLGVKATLAGLWVWPCSRQSGEQLREAACGAGSGAMFSRDVFYLQFVVLQTSIYMAHNYGSLEERDLIWNVYKSRENLSRFEWNHIRKQLANADFVPSIQTKRSKIGHMTIKGERLL